MGLKKEKKKVAVVKNEPPPPIRINPCTVCECSKCRHLHNKEGDDICRGRAFMHCACCGGNHAIAKIVKITFVFLFMTLLIAMSNVAFAS